MATLDIDGRRIVVGGHTHERKAALQIPGAGVRGKNSTITLPLNELSWHELRATFPASRHTYSPELLKWHADEEPPTSDGERINAGIGQAWGMPDLWDHQVQAIDRLLRWGSTALFDDTGMGKTRVVVEAIRAHMRDGDYPAVVVTKKRIRETWVEDTARWWSPSAVVAPTARIWSEAAPQVGTAPITVLTYESLLNKDVVRAIDRLNPEWLVVDEAHNLKKRNRRGNPRADGTTQATKSGALRKLPGRRRIALSGSPMPNRWDEVWTLLNIVAPQVFTSYWQFVEILGEVRTTHWGGKEVSRDIRQHDLWQAIYDRWIIARARPRTGTVWDFVPVVLSSVERAAYSSMQQNMRVEMGGQTLDAPNALAQATRLQQLAGGLGEWKTWEDDEGRTKSSYSHSDPSAKIDRLMDMIDGLDRVVIWTRFRDRAEFVAHRLRQVTPPSVTMPYPITISGGTSEKETSRALRRFAHEYACPLALICVYGTISEGVNQLVRAHDVFILDWTTQKDVGQAVDRCDRPGQDRRVRVVTLYAKDTIDEAAIDREAMKVRPLRQILRSPDAWGHLLSPFKIT